MEATRQHQSVMLREAIEALAILPNGIYVDATYGCGGHSTAILDLLNDQGHLFAMDKDPEAVELAKTQHGEDKRFHITHDSFAELAVMAETQSIFGSVNGILFDLGVSSPHLDEARRGFSFWREGPLDMRMNTTRGMTAAEWLSSVSEDDLVAVLREYGEERYARRIARAIVSSRDEQPIDTTKRLATIIAAASPSHEKHKHPATRSFQAIRIFINQELEELESALNQALEVLAVGGRLVVISFHSLEDRIVKRFIQQHTQANLPRGLPVLESQICKRLVKVGKATRPSESETKINRRARSATLRVVEKIS